MKLTNSANPIKFGLDRHLKCYVISFCTPWSKDSPVILAVVISL